MTPLALNCQSRNYNYYCTIASCTSTVIISVRRLLARGVDIYTHSHMLHTYTYTYDILCDICTYICSLTVMVVLRIFVNKTPNNSCIKQKLKNYIATYIYITGVSLSTVVLNSRDRQGMYGMQHFRTPINKPHNSL